MEAIKLLEPYFLQIKGFVIYAQYCVESDLHAPVCRDFWTGALVAAFVIALLLTLVIGKRLLREQLEFRRNKKRLAARAIVADEETMQQHKVDV
jgi:hypothetical protein